MGTGWSPYCSWRHLQSDFRPQTHTLTHPDFPELPGSELLHQLDGLARDLPGVFVPGFLRFGADTSLLQSSAQAI